MATTLIEAQKHNFPKFQLLLRIYAGTNNLDSKLVKELFASDSSSPRIKRQYLDEHDGRAEWESTRYSSLQHASELLRRQVNFCIANERYLMKSGEVRDDASRLDTLGFLDHLAQLAQFILENNKFRL